MASPYVGEPMPAPQRLCGLEVGQKVKLVDYSGFTDWEEHKNQIGTIVEFYTTGDLPVRIKWTDGSHSATRVENCVCIVHETCKKMRTFREFLQEEA